MSGARRVFYVPNEIGDALQSGYRRAFADLLAAGALDEVGVFSLERRIRQGGDAAAHRADLVRAVLEFRPDVLFMQHLGATGLTRADLDRLLSGGARLLYQEADPYTALVHPLPRAARLAGAAADVVFTVGAGTFTTNFVRSGARRVEWTPSVFDPARAPEVPGERDRESDVAIVANRSRARIRHLPSSGRRIRFIELMQREHGDRLALYGRGWEGPGARGPIPYDQQTDRLKRARISANWDHFESEPCYFSDRLAISLAGGSIFATTLHPGYGAVLPPAETQDFLITGSSPEDLVERIGAHLAATSPDQRRDAEERARAFAWAHLRQDDHLVPMLNAVGVRVRLEEARDMWDLDRPGLSAT